MNTVIAKTWTFDAAHHLPNHDGKCARDHGHTYTLTVEVEGEPKPLDGRSDEGMVVDFGVLAEVWEAMQYQLDHRDLNDSLAGEVEVTTCELLAAWAYNWFRKALPAVNVRSVRVAETASSYAQVWG